MFCGVRLDEHDIERLHDDHCDLCYMSRWELVCWWCGPTCCVHLHCGLLFGRWCRHSVRWHGGVVRDMYRWELVPWRCSSTRFVYV